jgi:hypothetical protein
MTVTVIGNTWMLQASMPLNLGFQAQSLGFKPYKSSSLRLPPQTMHPHASSCIAFVVAKWGIDFWFEPCVF